METLVLPLQDKRFVVSNKGKILIITHNRRYAEYIARLINKNNYPKSYGITVVKK